MLSSDGTGFRCNFFYKWKTKNRLMWCVVCDEWCVVCGKWCVSVPFMSHTKWYMSHGYLSHNKRKVRDQWVSLNFMRWSYLRIFKNGWAKVSTLGLSKPLVSGMNSMQQSHTQTSHIHTSPIYNFENPWLRPMRISNMFEYK